jgi:hypothetical protein
MTEQKSEKKVFSRNVALEIVCIILAVALVGVIVDYSFQISSLNSRVNDLNSIVNFQKQEIWFSNESLTLSPNQNVSEGFYAPFSGNAQVEGYVQPNSSGIWTNLTSWVFYGPYYPSVSPYPVSQRAYVDAWTATFFKEEFPIFSFASIQPQIKPNIGFIIGNDGTEKVTVNLTITFTY